MSTNERRRFLKQVLIAGGTVAGIGVLRPGLAWARATPSTTTTAADAPNIAAGMQIGRWTVVEIRPLTDGGVPVIMAGADGVKFQVDLTRRDEKPGAEKPVAVTEELALYLSNGGSGSTATVEEHGLGVMALAAHLNGKKLGLKLLTLRQRQEIYRMKTG